MGKLVKAIFNEENQIIREMKMFVKCLVSKNNQAHANPLAPGDEKAVKPFEFQCVSRRCELHNCEFRYPNNPPKCLADTWPVIFEKNVMESQNCRKVLHS
jgi:hypothetical protein